MVPKKSLAWAGLRATSLRMYISRPSCVARKKTAEKLSPQLKRPRFSGPRYAGRRKRTPMAMAYVTSSEPPSCSPLRTAPIASCAPSRCSASCGLDWLGLFTVEAGAPRPWPVMPGCIEDERGRHVNAAPAGSQVAWKPSWPRAP